MNIKILASRDIIVVNTLVREKQIVLYDTKYLPDYNCQIIKDSYNKLDTYIQIISDYYCGEIEYTYFDGKCTETHIKDYINHLQEWKKSAEKQGFLIEVLVE